MKKNSGKKKSDCY